MRLNTILPFFTHITGRLLSDYGLEFKGKSFKQILRGFDIEHVVK